MQTLSALFAILVLSACGGGDDEPERAESSRSCEEVCDFWARCNNRELEEGACADHCDEQTSEVSDDCLALYTEKTDCEVDNLDCSDRLGTACEAEYNAYNDCESGQ